MPGSEQGGLGVKLKITVSAALTAVANVEEVEFPELEKIMADITAHDSGGGWDETIPSGRFNSSEFEATLTWNADDSSHAAITAAFGSTVSMPMSIEDPAGVEVLAFNGFVTKMGRVAELDEAYRCKVTFKATGPINITNAV